MNGPDRIWLDTRPEQIERYGCPFVTCGPLAGGSNTGYVRDDPFVLARALREHGFLVSRITLSDGTTEPDENFPQAI